MENLKTYAILAMAGMIIILLLICGYLYNKKQEIKYIKKVITKIDSIPKIIKIPGKTTRIKGDAIIEYRTIYLQGATIETKPFIARLDTIVNQDTLNLKFLFPENEFEFMLRTKPDSIQYYEIVRHETITIDKKFSIGFHIGIGMNTDFSGSAGRFGFEAGISLNYKLWDF